MIYNNIGDYYKFNKINDKALDNYYKTYAIRTLLGGKNDPDVGFIILSIA